MIDTGKYRTDVTALSSISIIEYERIFKIFTASIEDKDFYVYNTLKKLEFPTIDAQYLGTYNVRSDTPMTIVSHNIYENIGSWWILYLLNKDKFDGAPFYVNAGTELKYIQDAVRSSIYADVTQGTVFGGRHY